MPHAVTKDNVKLYYEEVGSGTPILFGHEFAGDHRSWEEQMRFFSRRHRCITYAARGYTPSDVPKDPADYTYMHWVDDAVAILDHLKIDKAHFVGLSMGGYTAVMLGVHRPERLLSLTAAGAGSGSELDKLEEIRKTFITTADQFEQHGSAHVAKTYLMAAARIPFLIKDPRGFEQFSERFASHDAKGSANTLRGFQCGRPSLYACEDDIRKITTPTLIVVGDEDEPCVEPSLFLKNCIAPSGLVVLPKTGHVVNEEEPMLFNQVVGDFISRVEAGRWLPRDPRSIRALSGRAM